MSENLNYCSSVRIFHTGYCTNNKVLMRHKHTKYERHSYRKIYWTKWLRWWWILTQFLHKMSTALAIYPAEKRLDYVSLGLLAKFAAWWLENDFPWWRYLNPYINLMACVTNLLRYPATEFIYDCSYLKLNASDLFSQLILLSFGFIQHQQGILQDCEWKYQFERGSVSFEFN